MIIDAHIHLSTFNDHADSLEVAFEKLQSQMKKYGISHGIVIPDNIENLSTVADLSKARELIGDSKNLFLLGSPQIIQRGNSEVDQYKKLLESKIIYGIKIFPGHDPFKPTDERCKPYYKLLEDLGYPLVIHTGGISDDPKIVNPSIYNDPKYIVEVAKEFPNLKVIITHFFWPEIDYCYEITKNIPNIYFELAGCADGEVLKASGGIGKMIEVLKRAVKDRPDKIIYGTDWPMCDWDNKSGFAHHIELVKNLGLASEIEEMIFSKNAINIYKLPFRKKF